LLIGSWWLLREIEAAGAQIEHVTRPTARTTKLLLPVSKADPTALGEERTHCCICKDNVTSDFCPACALWEQRSYALGISKGDVTAPLFPNAFGFTATKKAAVDTIIEAAKQLELPIHTASGALRFTGHTMRCSGAVYLAGQGVDLWRIQLLGRWGSETFKLYTKKAPLLTMDGIALEAVQSKGLQEMRSNLQQQKTDALARDASPDEVVDNDTFLPLHLHDLEQFQAEEDCVSITPDGTTGATFVLNTCKKGLIHACNEVWNSEMPPIYAKALCGWKFGLSTNALKLTGLADERADGRKRCYLCEHPELARKKGQRGTGGEAPKPSVPEAESESSSDSSSSS
jgi:hypothetical protein